MAGKSLPLLDTLVSVGNYGLLVTTVYRKQTHRDQYLYWDNHQSISNKYSIFNILTHRVQTVCSDQQLLGQELQHIRTSCNRCNYPDWVFHRLQTKLDYQLSLQHHNNKPNIHKDINNTKNIFIVVPYLKGLSERFKSICGKAGVQIHFKGNNTIKDLSVASKDKDDITSKGSVIYRYKCDHLRSTMGYIGETGRTFGDGYKEHLRPSPNF